MLTNEAMLLIGLGAVTLVLMIGLILLLFHTRKMGRRLEETQAQLQLENQHLYYDLSQRDDRHQRQIAGELNQMNSALLNTLTSVTQSQTAQMEALQRQLVLSARAQEERMDRLYTNTEASLKKYDVRMETIRTTLETSLAKMQADNGQKLEEMRRMVDEKLHDTLNRRLGESFQQVSQQLEKVYKGLGEMQSLAAGVGDLKKVLSNVKTRGVWGEMQLSALLSQVLSPNQYDENVAVIPGSAERVEFAIRLPGQEDQPVYLPIDSKFPQEDYIRLAEASERGDKDACDQARKALMTRVKLEGRRISSKYIQSPYTTDFAIMFLPLEGLYAEVMREMGTAEQLQRTERVIIAGPSTLTALLNSLQMGFRTLAIEQRSAEVWKLLGAVKTDFGKFGDVLEKTQQRLRQASESIDSAFVRTRSIQRQLRNVEALSQPETLELLGDLSHPEP